MLQIFGFRVGLCGEVYFFVFNHYSVVYFSQNLALD